MFGHAIIGIDSRLQFCFSHMSYMSSFSSSMYSSNAALYCSLSTVMQHPSSARKSWLREFEKEHDCLTLSISLDDTLFWIDEYQEKYCLAFPALLDLKGSYNVKEDNDVVFFFSFWIVHLLKWVKNRGTAFIQYLRCLHKKKHASQTVKPGNCSRNDAPSPDKKLPF